MSRRTAQSDREKQLAKIWADVNSARAIYSRNTGSDQQGRGKTTRKTKFEEDAPFTREVEEAYEIPEDKYEFPFPQMPYPPQSDPSQTGSSQVPTIPNWASHNMTPRANVEFPGEGELVELVGLKDRSLSGK